MWWYCSILFWVFFKVFSCSTFFLLLCLLITIEDEEKRICFEGIMGVNSGGSLLLLSWKQMLQRALTYSWVNICEFELSNYLLIPCECAAWNKDSGASFVNHLSSPGNTSPMGINPKCGKLKVGMNAKWHHLIIKYFFLTNIWQCLIRKYTQAQCTNGTNAPIDQKGTI